MEPVIQVRNLRKTYKGGVEAVRDVSFDVHPAEVYGLLGRNGAGKTSALEMIEGMRSIDEGSVVVAGIDVRQEPARARRLMGIQLQEGNFLERLTLQELLELFADLYDVPERAAELLRRVNLEAKAGSRYDKLSGGQKRRMSIAVALVNDPKVMFLDEPTTGLDPHARRGVWDLVLGLKESGAAVVLTTHYIEEAQELCDRVGIMDAGRIIAEDTPRALIDALVATGFTRKQELLPASLEDVFIDLTGKDLVEAD